MGRDTVETIADLIVSQCTSYPDFVCCLRMPGNREIYIVENTFSRHKCFSGAAFFTRASEEHNRAFFFIFLKIFFHCYRSSDGADAEKVVTAAVTCSSRNQFFSLSAACYLAEAGECIKFAQETNDRFSMAKGACKCSRDIGNVLFNFKSFFFQKIAEDFHGNMLKECSLRVIPDHIAGFAEKFTVSIDCL